MGELHGAPDLDRQPPMQEDVGGDSPFENGNENGKDDTNKNGNDTKGQPSAEVAEAPKEEPPSKKQRIEEPFSNASDKAENNSNDGNKNNPQQEKKHQQHQHDAGGKKTSKKKVKTKHMDPKVLRVRKIIQEGCRTNDLASAMEAYEDALSQGIRVEAQSYYNLLNLCDGLDRDERKVHVGTPKQQPPKAKPQEKASTNADEARQKDGESKHNKSNEAAAANPAPAKANPIDSQQRQEYVFAIKEKMQSKEVNLPLNETAYSAIVKILSKNKEYSKAEEILAEAEAVQQCKPKLRLYASLLHAYCSARESDEASSPSKDTGDEKTTKSKPRTTKLVDALRCWKRLRQRATAIRKDAKAAKKSSGGGYVLDGMDLTEREYLSLIRCAARAYSSSDNAEGDPGNDLVMEDVLTRLAEDVPVPSKDTVAAILEWFQAQNKQTKSNPLAKPENPKRTIIQELLDEIRTYDTVSEPSPRMGPVVASATTTAPSNAKGSWTISEACSIDGTTGVLLDGCLKGLCLKPVPLSDGSFRDMTAMNESIVTDGNVKGNAQCKFQGGRKGKRRTDFSPDERRHEWKRFDDFLNQQCGVAVKASTGDGSSGDNNNHSKPSQRPYDVVIDGANIGYFKQNFAYAPRHVDYEQIDWVVRHFTDKLGKKVLLVMHNRHFGRHMLPDKYRPICDAWRNEGILYRTPPGMNDDWFWMHAALRFKTLVVTNDEMRDHHFQMLAPKFFLRWKERHQIHFDFGDTKNGNAKSSNDHRYRGSGRRPREVLLTYPDVYSRRIQNVADGLVVPLTKRGDENRFLDGCHVASKDEPGAELYLCIRPTDTTPPAPVKVQKPNTCDDPEPDRMILENDDDRGDVTTTATIGDDSK